MGSTALPQPLSSARKDSAGRARPLDLLRGLAIVGVIAIHVSQFFPSGVHWVDFVFSSGWTGVNVFFFVSAFTMCYMWKQREGEARPVGKFYIRRFLRIAPLFWLAIPLYLVLNGLGPRFDAPNGTGPAQVLLTATFLYGFWPDSLNSVVPGDWSIAAEMAFYALFPWLILRFGGRARAYLWLAMAIYFFNACLFKPAATPFFLGVYGPDNANFVRASLHIFCLNQLPIFLVGCFLFFSPWGRFSKLDVATFVLWVGLAFLADRAVPDHEFHYLLINLGIGACVYACVALRFRERLLEKIGQRSFSIYLTHFFVLHALRAFWPLPDGVASLCIAAGLTLAICYVLGLAAEALVERPVHLFAQRLTSPKIEAQAEAAYG